MSNILFLNHSIHSSYCNSVSPMCIDNSDRLVAGNKLENFAPTTWIQGPTK